MQRHCRIARQVPRLLNVCLGRNTYCHHGEFDDPIEKSWAREIEISEERDEILDIQHGAHKEDMMKHATDRVMKLASERAVVVFTLSSCCMCHTVTRMMSDLGVNAMVLELDNDPMGKEMERALLNMLGVGGPAVPAVFIGGRLVGGIKNVMSLHLSGKLVPMLRSVGECKCFE